MNEYDILELIVVSDFENAKRQMKAVFHVNPLALHAGIIKYYCRNRTFNFSPHENILTVRAYSKELSKLRTSTYRNLETLNLLNRQE